MKLNYLLILGLLPTFILAQQPTPKPENSKWEFTVGSGLYFDLFYANITLDNDDEVYNPPSYPNKKGRRVNTGITDRLELKYLLNNKSGISFYFQNSRYRDLLGSGNDPLGVWTDFKRQNRRMHFTLNYYRLFSSGKRGTWSIASGFQVQIEKISFPFYRVDNPVNPTTITYMGARPYWTYFEDWAIPLTVAHDWTINKNLKLGVMMNTAYTMGTGVDGLSLLGYISIPFGKPVKERKKSEPYGKQ